MWELLGLMGNFLGYRDCGRIAGLLPRDGSYLPPEDPLWINWEGGVAERKEAWLELYWCSCSVPACFRGSLNEAHARGSGRKSLTSCGDE